MNERVRELLKKAQKITAENHTPGGRDYEREIYVKFAELIAKECAEICKKQEYDYWRSSEDQDFTPQDCADAIEQHFGVSE